MINSLQRRPKEAICGPVKRRPKGWTLARRARQSARIRALQPWRRSTGPRSETGKARSAMNAVKHGFRSRARIFELRRVRYALRLAARNIAILQAFLRVRRVAHSLRSDPRTHFTSSPHLDRLRDVLTGITNAPMPAPPPAPQGIGFCPAQR